MEILNNAHHIRQSGFADLPQIWKQSIKNGNNLSKCADLLILTEQNWKFAPIYRKSAGLESNLFGW